jgi:NADPH2:quinone reductase
MRAIRFEAFGDPSVLKITEMAAPAANESTALVRIVAASINPSDVKNVAEAMKQTTLDSGERVAGIYPDSPGLTGHRPVGEVKCINSGC